MRRATDDLDPYFELDRILRTMICTCPVSDRIWWVVLNLRDDDIAADEVPPLTH